MQNSKRVKITGKAVFVEGNDIDTDRIIPARFLRCVTFDGLGEHAFEDDRKQLAEAGKTHPFDEPDRAGAQVLLVNKNFGCGSSREHAPQALARWNQGIQAVVGESFAEIFFGNCVAMGIPCVTADRAGIEALATQDPEAVLTVDLEAMEARCGQVTIKLFMPEGARGQLTTGRWDSTTELLQGVDSVGETAASLPYFNGWN